MALGKINIKGQLNAIAGESKFRDVKDGETVMFRIAPPDDHGMIFYKTYNHYKLRDVANDRGLALADLSFHGNDETGYNDYIMKLAYTLIDDGANDHEKKVGKLIKGNERHYAQGWEVTTHNDIVTYSKRKWLSLPKTAAAKVTNVAKKNRKLGEADFPDADGGQVILVSREGSGFDTVYEAERSGQIVPLSDVVPDYEAQLIKGRDAIYVDLNLNIFTPDEQKRIAKETYPELDWDRLEKAFGL